MKKSSSHKLKIGVLFGGVSSEKEISLESGRHIYNSLDRNKYDVIPIFLDSNLRLWLVEEYLLWMNTTLDIEKNLKDMAKSLKYESLTGLIEFAFLALHGKYVEDGGIQGILELLNIPYNGSRILGSAVGMDKIFQKKLLKYHGLKYAKYIIVNKSKLDNLESLIKEIEKHLGFPFVVKPSREGCSTAVSKVKNQKELKEAIYQALKWDNVILVEEFLDFMEVTCTIIGNESPKALLPTETPAKREILSLEEKFLPGDAQMITPPRVPKEDVLQMQNEFLKAYKALSLCSYARIDAFWDKVNKKLYILEPNTLPGLTPSTHVFHQAAEAGMNPSEFLEDVIKYSLEI